MLWILCRVWAAAFGCRGKLGLGLLFSAYAPESAVHWAGNYNFKEKTWLSLGFAGFKDLGVWG